MVATVDMSHVMSSISWLRLRFFTSELFIAFRTAEAIALSDNIDEMNGIFPLIRGIRHKSCKMILLSHLLSDHRPWRILISKKTLNQQLINWIYYKDIIYSFPLKGQLDFSTWRASLLVIRLYNFSSGYSLPGIHEETWRREIWPQKRIINNKSCFIR